MVKLRVNRVWAMRDSAQAALTTIDSRPTLEDLRNAIRAIPTKDPAERSAVEKALQATEELAQVRALVIAHGGSAIIMPLLVLLVFWFAVISAGLSLFAPRNATTLTFNVVCALSIGGAIFLILEMDQAFGGIISISDAPLRAGLGALER